uniref:Glucuronosyltransferase n=1 Tax=Panagrellus redivivus TaxID=6233 RepID=A0A7E4ZZ45_PANRE
MWPQLVFLSVLFFAFTVNGYKILIYNPKLGQSHVNFMGKLADVLVNAGHAISVGGFLACFVETLIVDPIVKSSETAIREFYPDFDSDAAFANAAFVFVNAQRPYSRTKSDSAGRN